MKKGDQIICTYNYVTHNGRKLFSIGDITTVESISCKDTRFNDTCLIKLKDSEELLDMEILCDTIVTDLCGNEYFRLHQSSKISEENITPANRKNLYNWNDCFDKLQHELNTIPFTIGVFNEDVYFKNLCEKYNLIPQDALENLVDFIAHCIDINGYTIIKKD